MTGRARPAPRAGLTVTVRRFEQTTQPPSDPDRGPPNEFLQGIREAFSQYKTDFLNFYYKNPRKVQGVFLGVSLLLGLYYFWDKFYPDLGFYELLRLIEAGEVAAVRVVQIVHKNGETEQVAFSTHHDRVYRTELIDFQRFQEVFSHSSKLVPVSMQTKDASDTRVQLALEFFYLAINLYFLSNFIRNNGRGMPMTQANSLNDFMKSKAMKVSVEHNLKKRFGDVAGMDEAKLEITEFVDFLKQPEKYSALGAKIPKGALLFGPPGTGKTLLGKACAGEAGVPFFYASGSEFHEVFVGVGSSRVRDLFDMARKAAPCIIFIDEIDAIAKKRSDKINASSEVDSTLNQLLVEMDGFDNNKGIVVFGATNRKDILDPAILRPGRLDRMVEIVLPDLEARRDIFKVHLKKLTFDLNLHTKDEIMDVSARRLASLTPGFSGADIENICNEAAIQAVRAKDSAVREQHFETAVERIIGGVERKKFGDEKMKKTVAVHESGHGVVAWFLPGADPLLKLTIIPRSKGSLGFAQYLPKENSLDTQNELMDKICAILGGRCAEQVFFGQVTTGAYDDFQKAYNIAYNMVTRLGMSRLGNVSLEINQFGIKGYSDATNRIIDDECKRIIDECTQITLESVRTHRDKIAALSDLLLQKQTITLKDIIGVLGERPFPVSPSFKAVLEHV